MPIANQTESAPEDAPSDLEKKELERVSNMWLYFCIGLLGASILAWWWLVWGSKMFTSSNMRAWKDDIVEFFRFTVDRVVEFFRCGENRVYCGCL